MENTDKIEVCNSSTDELKKSVVVMRKELQNIRTKLLNLEKLHYGFVGQIQSQQMVKEPSEWVRMNPIGYLESPFARKNATPRQSSLCQQSKGKIKLLNNILNNPAHALQGLDQFSHVWLIFVFHQNKQASYKKGKVAPPRLDGQKIGVFATRSPHRINPLGLSLVKLEKIEGDCLYLSGLDMIDGTPILDIKPYIPCYDEVQDVPTAVEGETTSSEDKSASVVVPDWITSSVHKLKVRFTPTADAQLSALINSNELVKSQYPDLQSVQSILVSILREDPRSIYRKNRCKELLYHFIYDVFHFTCWVDEPESVVEVVKVNKMDTVISEEFERKVSIDFIQMTVDFCECVKVVNRKGLGISVADDARSQGDNLAIIMMEITSLRNLKYVVCYFPELNIGQWETKTN